MQVVDGLDHCLVVMEPGRIRQMMKKQNQIVGADAERLKPCGHSRCVLSGEARARGHAPVHADTARVRAVPLTPTVAL